MSRQEIRLRLQEADDVGVLDAAASLPATADVTGHVGDSSPIIAHSPADIGRTVEQGRPARPRSPRRVAVLLPYPFAGPFDYSVDGDDPPRPGDLVLVPLNRRAELGIVWDRGDAQSVDDSRLKPVSARLDVPPLPDTLRRFIDWVARYTLSPPGLVLAMALRVDPTAAARAAAGMGHRA